MKYAIAAIAIVASFNVNAFEEQKNDMMCLAINQAAVEQYTAESDAIQEKNPMSEEDLGRAIIVAIHIDYYTSRVQLFRWNANQDPSTNLTVFNTFAKRYMDELDSPTVLLHLDRCEYRVFEIWDLYQALKN